MCQCLVHLLQIFGLILRNSICNVRQKIYHLMLVMESQIHQRPFLEAAAGAAVRRLKNCQQEPSEE